jgi:hypothetical protein
VPLERITNPQLARDFIAKIKADRRAELARIDAEAAARVESERQRGEQSFNADVSAALAQLDAAWLAEFRDDDAPVPGAAATEWQDDDGVRFRRARFAVPGHNAVDLVLTWLANRWADDGEVSPWFARNDRGQTSYHDTLADALIAAEVGPPDANPDGPIPF